MGVESQEFSKACTIPLAEPNCRVRGVGLSR
jgi:hypothetical protein